MKIGTLCKIIYGCIAGRFIQKVARLLHGKKYSIRTDDQVVGLFAVFSNPFSSISPAAYLLIGEVEYEKVIYGNASVIYDILVDGEMVGSYSFERMMATSKKDFPMSYTSLSNSAAASRIITARTQKAVARAFKELKHDH